MANTTQKDILSRLGDLGEEALHKLPDLPGGNKLMEMMNQSRTRLDDVQKRLRGLDVLETRVNDLEHRLAKLEQPAAAKKSAAAKKPAANKPASS
ncbi:MAG: hypothetical protein H0T13_01455 [Actinobacteria bacterium]|nr:hypothetical protein [Actinomycetota bacterium]